MAAVLPLSKFLLLLLLLTVPRLGLSEGVDEEEDSNETVADDVQEPIGLKYMVLWDQNSLLAKRSSSWEDFNPDIESVNCTSNVTCTDALYDLDVALSYDSDLPSSPYCLLPGSNSSDGMGSKEGKCTCGPDRCVSYSRQYTNGRPFYYCGPCGWVGARCVDYGCTHHLAECRQGYCECVKDGVYYDMTYCYIPFYGQRMVIEMLIVTGIIVVCCAVLAYGYTRLGRRRADRRYLERWTRGSITQETPSDDTPPTYDDVVEDKLPSYQDALEMGNKNEDGGEEGISNPGFVPDHTLPPPYQEAGNTTTTSAATNDPQDLDSNYPTIASFPATTPQENGSPTEPSKTTENLKKSAATDEFFDPPEGDCKGPQDASNNRPKLQPIQQPLHAALNQNNQGAAVLVSEL